MAAGDSEREFQGWIAKDDAVEWHHRQAVRFAPKRGRSLALFYPEPESAIEAVSTGQDDKATHREPESTSNDLILMPLLKVKDVKVDEEQMQLYEMAFMAGRPETAPATFSNLSRTP